jgi:hypothetical protein
MAKLWVATELQPSGSKLTSWVHPKFSQKPINSVWKIVLIDQLLVMMDARILCWFSFITDLIQVTVNKTCNVTILHKMKEIWRLLQNHMHLDWHPSGLLKVQLGPELINRVLSVENVASGSSDTSQVSNRYL